MALRRCLPTSPPTGFRPGALRTRSTAWPRLRRSSPLSRPDDSIPRADVGQMRAFAAAVLAGGPVPSAPAELVRRGNLGPLAYSLGLPEHRDDYAASLI